MKDSNGAFPLEVFCFDGGGQDTDTARFGLSLAFPHPDIDGKNAASV